MTTDSLGGVSGIIAIVGFFVPMFIFIAYITYDQNKRNKEKLI